MSSTTERARGQVLAIFAIGLVAILAAAALAFDVGMVYVERRDEQNAADAAALAGARFLPDSSTKARAAAFAVAQANGYATELVTVSTPYAWAARGATEPSAGFIEVRISNPRPSFFAGVLDIMSWRVTARAVAANVDDVAVSFSILSLHPTACPGLEVAGSGKIVAAGDVQVDSECNKGALKMVATGTSITVEVGGKTGACSVHGTIKGDTSDGAQFACETIEGAPQAFDPFETTPAPPEPPALPLPMEQIDGDPLDAPDGCPGSASPATSTEPETCQFPSSYKDTAWLVHPGLYPGGLKLNSGTFYLMPGVYYIEGGGVDLGGGEATIMSVASADDLSPGGGVLFYNTKSADSPAGPITLNGGDSDFYLEPYDGRPWDGFVIFQDRTVDIKGDDITINGSDSDLVVRGLIYGKLADVKVNGSAGDIVTDQVIADTFYISGGGGTIEAKREGNYLPTLTIAGLVE